MSRFRRLVWPVADESEQPGRLLAFTGAAVVVGVFTGIMAAGFRLGLERLADLRLILLSWAQGRPLVGVLVACTVCALGAALAAALVRIVEPHAEGSGIPRVEAVVAGRTGPGGPLILPVKFIGGLLAMGAGLALGREGPSVQMGGNIGIIVARVTRRNRHDLRVLVAAGAAAGLGTAFNAPIAGGVFVLEELVRRFDPRTTIATLLAAASGFASAHLLVGAEPLFQIAALPSPRLSWIPVIVVLGVVTGLAGVAYNWLILSGLRLVGRVRWPREVTAAVIGAAVGLTGFFVPGLIGGGDPLTQRALLDQVGLAGAVGILTARVVLGVVSYAANTPGGLFAPMLVVGSYLGVIVALLFRMVLPAWTPPTAALALIGMAAFFTATVRAPITGIVLATELTGATTQLPPMLGACAVAMLVATMCRSVPIYDALTARAARAARVNARERPDLYPPA